MPKLRTLLALKKNKEKKKKRYSILPSIPLVPQRLDQGTTLAMKSHGNEIASTENKKWMKEINKKWMKEIQNKRDANMGCAAQCRCQRWASSITPKRGDVHAMPPHSSDEVTTPLMVATTQ